MDPLDILQNVRYNMPSKPCKFGVVIFLCHCVVRIQVFILGKSAKLVKVTALEYVTNSLLLV